MKTLEKIYRILGIPAVIVHELSHILWSCIFGKWTEGISINMVDKSTFKYEIFVWRKYTSTKYINIIISAAPCITLLAFIILSFFSFVILGITIYLLIFINFSFMSAGDAKVVFHYNQTAAESDLDMVDMFNP